MALSSLLAPISLPIITTAALARPKVSIINKFITVVQICIDAAALVPILAYIAAYVIVPRAQQASFVNIGIVTLLRVEESDFDSPNIFFTFNFKISILVYTEQTTIKNSTILAIRVARAAPLNSHFRSS